MKILRSSKRSCRLLRLPKIALVLVRLDHVASRKGPLASSIG